MIPLVIFLYIYLGILAVCAFFGIFNIYALFRFGASGAAMAATLLFFAGVSIVLALTLANIQTINWGAGIDITPSVTNITL